MMSGTRRIRHDIRHSRLFTLEDANRTLPLVRAIVSDLAHLSQDVAERRQRVAYLVEGRELAAGDPYADELALTRDELQRDVARVEGYVRELQQLGLKVPNGPAGVVEFPSELEGRPVYLSWQLGEPHLMYWRAPGAPLGNRQLLPGALPAGSRTGEITA